MSLLKEMRLAKFRRAVEYMKATFSDHVLNILYKVHRPIHKLVKIVKFLPTLWKDEDWDQAYMLYLLRHKLVNMKEYLRNGVLAPQEQRDLTIQINQTLDHIENYLDPDTRFEEIYGKCPVDISIDFAPTDETGKWHKLVLRNEGTGEELTEREDSLYVNHVMKQHTFEQDEWNAIWDTIKKYGQGRWD